MTIQELLSSAQGRGALLAVSVDGLAALRASHGDSVTRRLTSRLESALRSNLGPEDVLSTLEEDVFGVFLRAPMPDAPHAAAQLHSRLREDFRFALSIGQTDLLGSPEEILRQALLSLRAAQDAGGDQVHSNQAGSVRAKERALPTGEPSLAERYQRMVLVNRFALGLFSQPTLAQSLSAVGHHVLALTGAKYLSIHNGEASVGFQPLYRQGEKLFLGEAPLKSESALVDQVRRDRAPCWLAQDAYSLLGVPIGDPSAALIGVLSVGFPRGISARTDAALASLSEIARLLQNALLIERQLRHQRTLAALSEQSADPVLRLDLAGRITLWNRSAQELFLHSAKDAQGRTIQEFLLPKDRREEFLRALSEVQEAGKVRRLETILVDARAQSVPVEATLTRIDDENGRPLAMLAVLRDIRARKEAERMKADLVDIVSHEVRTPLTSIRGFAETMLESWAETSEEDKRRYLGVISSEAARLNRLVDEFLELSRVESTASRLNPEPLDLAQAAGRVVETFSANPSGVHFALEFEKDLPRPNADPDKIQRVLVNLIGNAVKYSPPQGVVRITGQKKGKEVEVSVIDEGPGIPLQARESLFQKFFRAGDSTTRRLQGSGLGLYIAKAIVEAHSGRISYESLPKGTRFHFTLPVS
ncbi:MAG: ATP-binding protein [Elusimicrobiota bacterium]|jgi:PAS domain S-box-containing protein